MARRFSKTVGVPADDQVTSLTGLGGNAGAAFTTTHWSVVLEAQGESPRHKKRSKNFVAPIGDLSTASCGDKVPGLEWQRSTPPLAIRIAQFKS